MSSQKIVGLTASDSTKRREEMKGHWEEVKNGLLTLSEDEFLR
jgi:hypothetical protein